MANRRRRSGPGGGPQRVARRSPPDAAHDGGGREPTRREFLYLAGLASATVLSACVGGRNAAVPRGRVTDLEIGIVGAGLAGLTAAYWLSQAGVTCSVFDAGDRVGGRCWSARDFDGGLIGEHGGEFIDTRHVHVRYLVEDLGLDLVDLWAEEPGGATYLQHVDGSTSAASVRHPDLTRAVERLADVAAHGRAGDATDLRRVVELDEMTAEEWYVTEVGPTSGARYRLWSLELSSWYGLDPSRLGAGNLLDLYVVDYDGADERYTVAGGNDQIPTGLADALPAGSLQLETPVEAVSVTGTGQIELTGRTARLGSFDHAVLAIPFSTLRGVDIDSAGFASPMRRAIDDLAMGTNSKLMLQFDRPFTDFDRWSGEVAFGDDPVFQTWDSGIGDGADGGGLLTVFTGGNVGAAYGAADPHLVAPASIVSQALGAIDAAVPGVSGAYGDKAWLDWWVADPLTRGSYAAFGPGQMSKYWGKLGQRQGNIHLAGEHTSTFSQGYLNGGVESGCRVAAEILEDTGIDLPPGLIEVERRAKPFAPPPLF